MQGDGNLVLYGGGNQVYWQAGTAGKGNAPFHLSMQTDGNVVLYDGSNSPTWQTGTAGRPCSGSPAPVTHPLLFNLL
jgi:hypothetical protein